MGEDNFDKLRELLLEKEKYNVQYDYEKPKITPIDLLKGRLDKAKINLYHELNNIKYEIETFMNTYSSLISRIVSFEEAIKILEEADGKNNKDK